MNDKMFTVKLPSDLHEAVMAKAAETHVSVSALVRATLRDWVIEGDEGRRFFDETAARTAVTHSVMETVASWLPELVDQAMARDD